MLQKQILRLESKEKFLNQVKNIFASRTQILRPKRMFPSLASQGNTSGNNVSVPMFPSLARPLPYFHVFAFSRSTIAKQCEGLLVV